MEKCLHPIFSHNALLLKEKYLPAAYYILKYYCLVSFSSFS